MNGFSLAFAGARPHRMHCSATAQPPVTQSPSQPSGAFLVSCQLWKVSGCGNVIVAEKRTHGLLYLYLCFAICLTSTFLAAAGCIGISFWALPFGNNQAAAVQLLLCLDLGTIPAS